MKRSILFFLGILYAVAAFPQSNATDFSAYDCDGNYINLFSILDEGKVVVITWVMPCGPCIGPALESYLAAKSFEVSHPGMVNYFLADDFANTPCATLKSWGNSNSMDKADAYFSDAAIDMLDYGSIGMPKVVVVGCSSHEVFYNQNYTAEGVEDAISQALESCETISSVDGQHFNDPFDLMVSPNPASSSVTIFANLVESGSLQMDVINLAGNTVVDIDGSVLKSGPNEIQIDTHSLPQGIYFVRLRSATGSQVCKFSVIR